MSIGVLVFLGVIIRIIWRERSNGAKEQHVPSGNHAKEDGEEDVEAGLSVLQNL